MKAYTKAQQHKIFAMALCTIVLRKKAFVQQAPCTTSPGLP